MGLTSGFFNSVNSDRRYDAEQMSMIFDGIINDGIYDSIGNAFAVVPSSGMTVACGIGRAWLNHCWVYNDSLYPITLAASSASLGRIDVICIKIDHSLNVRSASIVVVSGTPAADPVAPTIPADDTTNGIYYHKIATVSVAAGTTAITSAMITTHIGLSDGTPYVTGIIASSTFDQLWNQLEGEFMDWWNNTIKPILNPEVVTQLQNNIDHITAKEATMRKYGFSHQNPPPSGYTYKEYSSDALFDKLKTLVDNAQSKADQASLPTETIYSVLPSGTINVGNAIKSLTRSSGSFSTLGTSSTLYVGTGVSYNISTQKFSLTGVSSITLSTSKATALSQLRGKFMMSDTGHSGSLGGISSMTFEQFCSGSYSIAFIANDATASSAPSSSSFVLAGSYRTGGLGDNIQQFLGGWTFSHSYNTKGTGTSTGVKNNAPRLIHMTGSYSVAQTSLSSVYIKVLPLAIALHTSDSSSDSGILINANGSGYLYGCNSSSAKSLQLIPTSSGYRVYGLSSASSGTVAYDFTVVF